MRLRADELWQITVATWTFLICVALIALLFAIAGCSTIQVPKVEQTVVKTDCHPQPVTHVPWATSAMTSATDIYDQAKLLLQERQQRKDYEHELEAAAKACQ